MANGLVDNVLGSMAVSGNGSASFALELGRKDRTFDFQAVWTGTVSASISLEGSVNNVNWDTVPNSTQTMNGGPGQWQWNYDGAGFRYVRPVITGYSSGSGTVNCWAEVKES